MQNGKLNILNNRLQENLKEQQMKTEELFKTNFQALSKKLQESSENVLNTIENAIKTRAEKTTENLNQHFRTMNSAYGKRWIYTILLSVVAVLGITIGSWSLLKVVTLKITTNLNTLDQLETRIQEANHTLYHLEKDTHGIFLMEEEKGKFIVLPENTETENWKYGTRHSLRLIEK